MEGLGSVFGGAGVRRLRDREGADGDEAGAATALFLGSFSGIVSDIRGPRKACMLFCILHLLVRVLKCMSKHPSMWITNICLALASVFLFCFKTWMVTEHEKQGHRQDLLNETFWLMTFFESASLFGSQGLTNWLVKDLQKGFLSPAVVAALMAMISIPYIRKGWKGDQHKSAIENYRKSFAGHILKEKKDWLLAWAQTSTYISLSVFWVLWAPTIVADESLMAFLDPHMLTMGYTMYSEMKPGLKEGCITAFRLETLEFDDHIKLNFLELAQKKLKGCASLSLCEKPNVALILKLRWKAHGTLITVSNTHLSAFSNPARIFQCSSLLEALERFAGCSSAIFMCGDYNTPPDSSLYDLLTKGEARLTGEGVPELLKDMRITERGVRNNLPRLRSAYNSLLDANVDDPKVKAQRENFRVEGEPLFTQCSAKQTATLDYIFYTVETLKCVKLLELPIRTEELARGRLPSPRWPSDHVSLMAEFRLRQDQESARMEDPNSKRKTDIASTIHAEPFYPRSTCVTYPAPYAPQVSHATPYQYLVTSGNYPYQQGVPPPVQDIFLHQIRHPPPSASGFPPHIHHPQRPNAVGGFPHIHHPQQPNTVGGFPHHIHHPQPFNTAGGFPSHFHHPPPPNTAGRFLPHIHHPWPPNTAGGFPSHIHHPRPPNTAGRFPPHIHHPQPSNTAGGFPPHIHHPQPPNTAGRFPPHIHHPQPRGGFP